MNMSSSDPWSVYNLRVSLPLPSRLYISFEADNHQLTPGSSRNELGLAGASAAQDHDNVPSGHVADSHTKSFERDIAKIASCDASPNAPLRNRLSLQPTIGQDAKYDEYGTELTGSCTPGNSGRFTRQGDDHEMVAILSCGAIDCEQVFHREDHRLNHERKRHPELAHPTIRMQSGATGDFFAPCLHDRYWYAYGQVLDPWSTASCPPIYHSGDHDFLYAIEDFGAGAIILPSPARQKMTQSVPILVLSGDSSTTHDDGSIFSERSCAGLTTTDVSSIPEPTNLQHIGDPQLQVVEMSDQRSPCSDLYMDDLNDLDDKAEIEAMFASLRIGPRATPTPERLLNTIPAQAHGRRNPHSMVAGDLLPEIEQVARVSALSDQSLMKVLQLSLPANDGRGTTRTQKDCLRNLPDVHTGQLQALPPHGQRLIQGLKAELDPTVHLRLWTDFFNRWEDILDVLQSRRYGYLQIEILKANVARSKSYHLFAPVLDVIRRSAQLPPADLSEAVSSEAQRPSTACLPQESTTSTKKRASSNNQSKSVRKRLKQGSNPSGEFNEEVQVKLHNETKEKTQRRVDCIIHKHYLMNGKPQLCPCHGFGAKTMAELRIHLDPKKRKRRGDHGGLMTLLKVCAGCKEDVVDKEVWAWHKAHRCSYKTQSRADTIEARWARLYLARYPNEFRIPSPCKYRALQTTNRWSLTQYSCR